jgi:PAS domain S-box-containing protein
MRPFAGNRDFASVSWFFRNPFSCRSGWCGMTKRRPLDIAWVIALALMYFGAGRLGLSLALINPSASAVFPPTGLALAAMLLLGNQAWPGILVGSFFVNWLTPSPAPVALIIAIGNTLEAWCGAELARRFARGPAAFERAGDIFRYVLLAVVPSTALSATIGVASLALSDPVASRHFLHIWFTWWIGNVASDLVVAPLLIIWMRRRSLHFRVRQVIEATILICLLLVVGWLRFIGPLSDRTQNYPIGFLTVPLIIWGAYRFRRRGAIAVATLTSALAIWGTLRGLGPFARVNDQNDALVLLQLYIAVVTLTGLVLAALVSEQAEAEKALRNQEQHLRMALESGQMGTWHWDMASGKVAWSTALEAIHGLAPGTFAGTFEAFLADVHPEDRDHVNNSISRALARRSDHRIEYRLLLKSGEIRWVEGRGRLVLDARGHPTGMVGVCTDVTDRARAQKDRELLLERERAARAEVERASMAKDQFLAVLSHELRTPLTPVLLTATLLEQDQTIPEHAQADLRTIRENVQLEARLIDDLLDLTRIARGKLMLEVQTTELHALIQHAIEICSGGDSEKIRASLSATSTFVRADPARIQQVFWNLLNNAVKFTPLGKSISVRTRNEGEFIVAEVVDAGVGIDPELLPRLFNAFEQGDAVRERKIGGLGLGLAISKALVTAHGGSLAAYSAGAGKGATFTVRLPLVAAPTSSVSDSLQGPGAAGKTPRRPLRILLVEDHQTTLMVMERLLASKRHVVTTANSIASAMQAAEKERFDLVISDLGLPDGLGYDMMRWVHERYGTRGIAISGYGMDSDIEKSRAAGFAEHLVKPVDVMALEAAIARVFIVPS